MDEIQRNGHPQDKLTITTLQACNAHVEELLAKEKKKVAAKEMQLLKKVELLDLMDGTLIARDEELQLYLKRCNELLDLEDWIPSGDMEILEPTSKPPPKRARCEYPFLLQFRKTAPEAPMVEAPELSEGLAFKDEQIKPRDKNMGGFQATCFRCRVKGHK